jgi:hypothetical protein
MIDGQVRGTKKIPGRSRGNALLREVTLCRF